MQEKSYASAKILGIEVGERLQFFGKGKYGVGWQGELERLSGLSTGTLSHYKTGTREAKVSNLIKLAPFVNLHWLLTGIGPMEPPAVIEETRRIEVELDPDVVIRHISELIARTKKTAP